MPAMMAMGDLYYYGARGLPRDYTQALNYFNQAAERGDANGMCGAANMYLKGEGTPVNVTRSIELYENATAFESVRAFNGLGYIYYYGHVVPKDEKKAFEYFYRAAVLESDGDSLFNAAYCMQHGIGTNIDLVKAIRFYEIAANKLGHFDSVATMAYFYLEVSGHVIKYELDYKISDTLFYLFFYEYVGYRCSSEC